MNRRERIIHRANESAQQRKVIQYLEGRLGDMRELSNAYAARAGYWHGIAEVEAMLANSLAQNRRHIQRLEDRRKRYGEEPSLPD